MAKEKIFATSVNTEEDTEVFISDSKIKKKYGDTAEYFLEIGEVKITFHPCHVTVASIPEKQRKNYYWVHDQLYIAKFHSRFD